MRLSPVTRERLHLKTIDVMAEACITLYGKEVDRNLDRTERAELARRRRAFIDAIDAAAALIAGARVEIDAEIERVDLERDLLILGVPTDLPDPPPRPVLGPTAYPQRGSQTRRKRRPDRVSQANAAAVRASVARGRTSPR